MFRVWYWGLVQSGLWLLIAILNLLSGRKGMVIGFNLFVAALFAVSSLIQYFCEKKGKNTKKIMNRVSIAACVMLVLVFVAILLAL